MSAVHPQLIVLSGEHKGDVIVLDDPLPVVFGSRAGVSFPDPALDLVHCQVFLAHGRWFIQDFGSQAGTWLGDTRVEGLRPLEYGRTFRIGDTHVAFLLPDPAESADPEAVQEQEDILRSSAIHNLPVKTGADTDVIPLETPLPAPSGEQAGLGEHDSLGEYDILGVLGDGSLGRVYKGYDRKRRRVVALKVLDPKLSKDAQHVARFLRGAKAGGRLSHRHIVKVLGAGHAGGRIYVTMEYVEGLNLEQFCASSNGRLPPRVALGIAHRITDALVYAHGRDVIHRSVNPHNILIGPGGFPKLADLAQAKRVTDKTDLASSQVVRIAADSPYEPPESLHGSSKLDARSDVYGVGATLYRTIVGKPPYGTDLNKLAARITAGELEPLDTKVERKVSPKLLALLERCLQAEPEQRFQAMRELREGMAELPEIGLD